MGVFETRLTACPIRQAGLQGSFRGLIFRELFGFSHLQPHQSNTHHQQQRFKMAAIGSLVFCTDCGNLLDGSAGKQNVVLTCTVCGANNKGRPALQQTV
jgi:hypothetical protein